MSAYDYDYDNDYDYDVTLRMPPGCDCMEDVLLGRIRRGNTRVLRDFDTVEEAAAAWIAEGFDGWEVDHLIDHGHVNPKKARFLVDRYGPIVPFQQG